MTRTSKLSRAALVSAIALCFGAPAYATDNGPIVVAQAGGASGQGGSNSMQPGGAGATKDGTSGNTAPQPGPGTSGASGAKTSSGSAVSGGTAGPAKGSNSTNTARGAADNTNSRARTGEGDMNTWVNRHAQDNKGRISRQAYLDEMGRRWDALDRSSQGLTPAEVSRLTGKVDVDHSAPPRTGSGAQAGNMGPSSTKGN